MAGPAWSKTPCPLSDTQMNTSCTEPAHAVDRAVSFFFQVETRNAQGASFVCKSGDVVLCARSWSLPQSGSAGACFFLVPAGVTWQCNATEGVNVIDADSTPLIAGALAPGAPAALACPSGTLVAGSASESCSATAPTDAWTHVSYRGASPTGRNAFACSADGATVCAFSTSNTSDGGALDAGSCSFLLRGGAALMCTATSGSVSFDTTYMTALGKSYASSSPAAGKPCPPAAYPATNMCDCDYTSPATEATDTIVVIASTSVDGGFNSFHCGWEGVNVCGWGSNSGMNASAGSCVFVLPPNTQYSCEMEWGAASFTATSATKTLGSLFPPAAAAFSAPLAAAPHAPAPLGPHPGASRVARLWRAWRAEHGVGPYASAREEAARLHAFTEHVAAADAAVVHTLEHPHLDAEGLPMRFNRFADRTRAEWVEAHRGKAAPMAAAEREALKGASAAPPPAPPSMDWRERGVVTPVKDQAQCGSCWSFSTTGAVESAWAVAGNPLVSLSEQYLVSCDSDGNDGCDGGYPYLAIDFLRERGAVTEASYPYTSGGGDTGTCDTANAVYAPVNVTGFRIVPGNTSAATEAALEAWLAAYGPVSIIVDAMTQLWWPYTGGIMTGCCDVSTDHAVLLVGYDTTASGTPYWIVSQPHASHVRPHL